ncbi:hypothetical protein L2E82_37475 [Cichorium intybus]|uniref:Uncharacterized protein n=1 Tax=Cichorium intybus TaxID=13427 RepID=A0ACB9AF20_CICIN|nr:hypothetical protein L2E82_37475 [Cichorium intybus]
MDEVRSSYSMWALDGGPYIWAFLFHGISVSEFRLGCPPARGPTGFVLSPVSKPKSGKEKHKANPPSCICRRI